MSMRKAVLPVLTVLIVLGGCVPSLHKLYTAEDVVFKKQLLGIWSSGRGEDRWEFRNGGKKSYKLSFTDKKGETGDFKVHLVALDDKLFMDLYPSAPDVVENDFYRAHLLGVHSFMLVKQLEPTVKMAPVNAEKLEELLEDDPSAVKHEIVDGRVVLTAETARLQSFLLEHCDEESELFSDVITLSKKK